MELLGIRLQRRRGVPFGIDAQRVKEDIASEMVAQDLLYLCEARRLERTGVAALGVHQVDDEPLALQKVVVEAHGLPVLSRERNIREVIGSPSGAGRGPPGQGHEADQGQQAQGESIRRILLHRIVSCASELNGRGSLAGHWRAAGQIRVALLFAVNQLLVGVVVGTVPYCPWGDGFGASMGTSPPPLMSQRSSMALSSCCVLWQCSMYMPANSRNCIWIRTSPLGFKR